MHVWVTGATGQLGTEVQILLRDRGHDVSAVGRTSPPGAVSSSWIAWGGETGWELPRDAPAPDAIIHLAAQTSAYIAREDPSRDVMANVVGPLRLVQQVAARGTKPYVITAGAGTQRDDVLTGNVTQYDVTFYETGKHALDLYMAQLMREGAIDFTSLRLSNVYGGGNRSLAHRGFINASVHRALRGMDLTFFDGHSCIRDFLHVTDAAEAFVTALDNRDRLSGRLFAVGSGQRHPIRDALTLIAVEVERATGVRVQVVGALPPVGTYALELQDRLVDSTDFRQRTGWTAVIPLRMGVRRMVREALTLRG